MGLIELMGITTQASQAITDEKQDAAFESARLSQEIVDAGQNDALEVSITNQTKWNADQSLKSSVMEDMLIVGEVRKREQETRLKSLEERLSNYKSELDNFISKLAVHEQNLQQLNGSMCLARQLISSVEHL
jgi:hypothetical protein